MSLSFVSSDRDDKIIGEVILGRGDWVDQRFWPAVRELGFTDWGMGFTVDAENVDAFEEQWMQMKPCFVTHRPSAFEEVLELARAVRSGAVLDFTLG